jgi:hypothetical protein
VDEERQRRNVERQPLRLSRPIEKRSRERLELLDGIREPADLDVAELTRF